MKYTIYKKGKKMLSGIKNFRAITPMSRGFTLVEAMVAITILSLSVTAPLLIAQKGISSAIYARDQITAFYLAQEGVEYIRNVRDMNRIAGNPWLTNLTECLEDGSNKRCTVDSSYSNPTDASAINQCSTVALGNKWICANKIAFDTNNKIYGYNPAWTSTKFTRTISVDDRSVPNEALVAVTISWTTNLFAPVREFTVREYLFDY